MKILLIALALAGLSLSMAALVFKPSTGSAAGRITVESDIPYGFGEVRRPRPGRKELLLDLYKPAPAEGRENLPAILLLHGGGFRRGSKDGTIAVLARRLAEEGFVAAAINYRLVPDDPPGAGGDETRRALEAARRDAALALAWLREHADRYQIDPGRIAVGGSSAGAITALFLAYDKPSPSPPVGAVVSLWGGLYGREHLLRAGDPPLMIVHGTQDSTVPFRLATALEARCEEVGLDCQYWAVEGTGHGFAAIPPDFLLEGESLARRIADFLRLRLNSEKAEN